MDDSVTRECQETVKAYVKKGYLSKVPETEEPTPEEWYIPHDPIVRMDKSTTKVRIVLISTALTSLMDYP